MAGGSVSFEEAARAFQLSVQEVSSISRGEPIEGFGFAPELNRATFALSLNEVGGAVRTPSGFAILQPKEEIPASREAFEAEKETFQERTLQQKQLQHYNVWFQVLKTKAQLTSNIVAAQQGR